MASADASERYLALMQAEEEVRKASMAYAEAIKTKAEAKYTYSDMWGLYRKGFAFREAQKEYNRLYKLCNPGSSE